MIATRTIGLYRLDIYPLTFGRARLGIAYPADNETDYVDTW